MATTYKILGQSKPNAATLTDAYTVPAATTTVVVGLSVTNVTASAIAANVYIQDNSAANTVLVMNGPISSGSSLVVGGGDQKIVLVTGDQLIVQSSAATSLDAVMSIMEIT